MRDNIVFRLVTYYIVLIVLFVGLMRVFPSIPRYLAEERVRVARTEGSRPADLPAPEQGDETTFNILTPDRTIPIIVSLASAFLVILPVTWVYRWTRPAKRYNPTFAQTLLVVPIGIALVVFLVKGSLALAFSLAGIVAALRFRSNLDEPMDSVYMFIVIGAGLAAGVQLLTIAFLASVFFNATVLTVWKTQYGDRPAVVSGWRILQPEVEGARPAAGDAAGLAPEPEPEPKSVFNAKLRVQTTQVEAMQHAAIPILEANAKHWQVAQVTRENGTSVVEFDLRLKKSTDLASFIRAIEHAEAVHVGRVELRQHKASKE
jgi:hypothetical protein